MERRTLQDYKTVSDNVKSTLRRVDLTYNHHKELEEITGLERQTIKDYKSVADRTSSLRNDDLTFNHHREVAKLPPEKQSEYLSKASEEKLSVRDLRTLVKVVLVALTMFVSCDIEIHYPQGDNPHTKDY